MAGAGIRNIRIGIGIAGGDTQAEIGKNVRSCRIPVKPSAYRFIPGDKCRVWHQVVT